MKQKTPSKALDLAASTAKELVTLWEKHEEQDELKLRTSNFVARYGDRAVDLLKKYLAESSLTGDQVIAHACFLGSSGFLVGRFG